MHESSVARQILELSLAAATRSGGASIRVVHGKIAETETLSRDSIELHFRAHARETLAAAARLDLELVHVEARCRACGTTYRPEHHVLLCTTCGSTDGEELGPTGLWISAIEVEDAGT